MLVINNKSKNYYK